MRKLTCCAFIGAALILSGCSGLGDAMGFGRQTPDDFSVVDRPPLSLPPSFDLRPPRPGAARPQDISTTDKAAATLYAGSSQGAFLAGGAGEGEKSDAEKQLLGNAGVAKAEPNIRDVLDREAKQRVIGSDKLVDEVLWWRKSDSATTVDAAAEAARLREAKEKGEEPTQGKTPVISKGSSGWLGL